MGETGAVDTKPEQELANATNIGSRGAMVAGAISAFGMAVLALGPKTKDLPTVVVVGVFATVAVALLVFAAMIVTDIRTRGQVKVAQLQKGSLPAAASPAAASGDTKPTWGGWVPVTDMALTYGQGTDRWRVLALRSDSDDKSAYWVSRSGATPRIIVEEQVDETFYGADAAVPGARPAAEALRGADSRAASGVKGAGTTQRTDQ